MVLIRTVETYFFFETAVGRIPSQPEQPYQVWYVLVHGLLAFFGTILEAYWRPRVIPFPHVSSSKGQLIIEVIIHHGMLPDLNVLSWTARASSRVQKGSGSSVFSQGQNLWVMSHEIS